MPRCNHRLTFVLCSIVISTILLWGCTQVDDIPSSISQTNLNLSASRLPSTPTGMIYKLWVAGSGDTVSLGTFGWDNVSKRFLEPSGSIRLDSNKFTLGGDIMDYDVIFVSVEVADDPDGISPGPIMLIDDVTIPRDNPIELVFPDSDTLWQAVVRYNMQSTSDDSRGGDGKAIWFSSYREASDNKPDTIALRVDTIPTIRAFLRADTTIDSSGTPWDTTVDSTILTPSNDTLYKSYPPPIVDTTVDPPDTIQVQDIFIKGQWGIVNLKVDSSLKDYGPDTLTLGVDSSYHTYVTFDIDSIIDSIGPIYELRSFRFNYTTRAESVPLDIFTQDDFNLPDYSAYGWKYKGWIVTPYYMNDLDSRLTPPAWPYKGLGLDYIPGDTGALFTTGKFSIVTQPDLSGNKFAIGPKLPPFPGEDFLNPDSLMDVYGIDSVNFVPYSIGNVGTVFITLEPDNFPSDTTNFPLLLMIGEVPGNRSVVTSPTVSITMRNWSSTVPGDLRGFPKISVSMQRF